jgi:hypothetical protein
MTRDINRNYVLGLGSLIPQNRTVPGDTRHVSLPPRDWGPQMGNGLADCATCHHGAPKPLGGANLVQAFPVLAGADEASPSVSASLKR